MELKDFRLISLVGSLYKIIAKVLISRMCEVLGGIISNNQGTFIRDSLNGFLKIKVLATREGDG